MLGVIDSRVKLLCSYYLTIVGQASWLPSLLL